MNRFCFMARHADVDGGFVTLRQQRLDELLNRAFAKGARRAAKMLPSEGTPCASGAPEGDTGESVHSPTGGAAEKGGAVADGQRTVGPEGRQDVGPDKPQAMGPDEQRTPALDEKETEKQRTPALDGNQPEKQQPVELDERRDVGPDKPQAMGPDKQRTPALDEKETEKQRTVGLDGKQGIEAEVAPMGNDDFAADSFAGDGGKPEESETLAKASVALAAANARLLEALVLREAQSLHISQRGAEAAMKLCDFESCFHDGMPNEELVKGALAVFARKWPEFQLVTPPAPFAAGTGSDALHQDVLKNALGVV